MTVLPCEQGRLAASDRGSQGRWTRDHEAVRGLEDLLVVGVAHGHEAEQAALRTRELELQRHALDGGEGDDLGAAGQREDEPRSWCQGAELRVDRGDPSPLSGEDLRGLGGTGGEQEAGEGAGEDGPELHRLQSCEHERANARLAPRQKMVRKELHPRGAGAGDSVPCEAWAVPPRP